MGYVFTSGDDLIELRRKIKYEAIDYVVTRGTKIPFTCEGRGRNNLESYENLVKKVEKLARSVRGNKSFDGFDIGVCEVVAETIRKGEERVVITRGTAIYYMKKETNLNLRERDSQPI